MKPIRKRPQRTIARPAEAEGIGFITGKRIALRFLPAPANTGVLFARTDLGPDALIPAHIDHVTGTARRTTIGTAPVSVTLVEHVMAALRGMQVDNCVLELDGPEPPGLDGSSLAFVQALADAGVVLQTETKTVYAVETTVMVRSGDATLAIHPPKGNEFRISYLLDYGPMSPIVRQIFTDDVTPDSFLRGIAPCRTFLLEDEAVMLQKQGLGSNTKITDLLVFGPRGPIDNTLRFGNEPARHKALDVVGDLSLLGVEIAGHIVAFRSGHELNIELVRALSQQMLQVSLQRKRRTA
ncbi:MAG: UDP-3-O-acyl-N-acetylglucosamine deacetylase [Gemmataceae bacterium]|nr:UDP-3-O-acyl-N-acetylglucosamine deacetylase [Gemmataceae bacterium]